MDNPTNKRGLVHNPRVELYYFAFSALHANSKEKDAVSGRFRGNQLFGDTLSFFGLHATNGPPRNGSSLTGSLDWDGVFAHRAVAAQTSCRNPYLLRYEGGRSDSQKHGSLCGFLASICRSVTYKSVCAWPLQGYIHLVLPFSVPLRG